MKGWVILEVEVASTVGRNPIHQWIWSSILAQALGTTQSNSQLTTDKTGRMKAIKVVYEDGSTRDIGVEQREGP
jgi:hypothetical protein